MIDQIFHIVDTAKAMPWNAIFWISLITTICVFAIIKACADDKDTG